MRPTINITNVTMNSATQVAIAAPSFANKGISNIFNVKFVIAPKIVHFMTIFSLPCGYNICIPNTFDNAMNNNIGDNICKVEIAGSYDGPQKSLINVGAVTISPKNNGKLRANTKSTAFCDNRLKSSI